MLDGIFASILGLAVVIDLLLLFLIILDTVLSVLALGMPALWFRIFHGTPYEDPQGLLRRTGAIWVAFTLLQVIALVEWRTAPYWLVLIAGVRLTELFSDWTYIHFARNMTTRGRIALFIAPPGNLLMGWYLIESYLVIMSRA